MAAAVADAVVDAVAEAVVEAGRVKAVGLSPRPKDKSFPPIGWSAHWRAVCHLRRI